MTNANYVLSFTAGGLLYHESIKIAETYIQSRQWDETIKRVKSENLLQSRVARTTNIKLAEICPRLKTLTQPQIGLLVSGTRIDQNLLLWLACCKRYQFLAEFASEVLHAKFVRMEPTISSVEVDGFMESKAVWREEIEDLKESTRAKLITVVMRMLRETEMLSSEDIILPQLMSGRLIKAIASDAVEHFSLFPVAEADVRKAI